MLFSFPNAKNNQCFRVAYLMELPQEMVDMLNSNQTFSVDQLGLPTIPMTSGNKLPMMNMFENFDMAFVRSCLDSLSQHMNASMPEFEVVSQCNFEGNPLFDFRLAVKWHNF